MRLSLKKCLIFGASALILIFAFFQIFSINRSVRQTLADERARLEAQNRVAFEKKALAPHSSSNVRILQNVNEVRDFVRFQDSYFAAASGGLAQFSFEGKLVRHFTVLDGLPESDVTCLTVFGGKLFIGTRTKNLVVFDGERFENYVWTDRAAQAVTALLERDGKLLIGTFAGGLIEFDGENFAEIKADQTKISAVNCLAKDGAKLFVGTFNDGLWVYESDVWTHFTAAADKLPSDRIVGAAFKDEKTFVATDFGLAILEGKTIPTIAVLPALSGLLLHHNQLFFTKDDGEVFTFENSVKEFSGAENLQNARLSAVDDKLWLLSNAGISEFRDAKLKPFSRNESLTDNFVSALALDREENLWVGTFRRGIDVLNGAGEKIRHLETQEVREINYLQTNNEAVSAATSAGLIHINKSFASENAFEKSSLPSSSIANFSGDFIATAKGLAFRENGRIRVLSTIQGLPSNSVYAVLQVGKTVYAGTLGGLAQIENGRVTRVFKDSNSNLTTNWVTALCSVNEHIFIGTYGGGVFELLPSGEIRSFAAETGKFTVNQNALFSDGGRLYAGTLAGAKILDLQTQEWKTAISVLPSETVLSVTGDAENVYFGTANGIAKVNKKYFVGDESE